MGHLSKTPLNLLEIHEISSSSSPLFILGLHINSSSSPLFILGLHILANG